MDRDEEIVGAGINTVFAIKYKCYPNVINDE
jgi:hypothetical protein